MSSYVDTLEWCRKYSLDSFAWSDWIAELGSTLNWPVYSMSEIVDAAAAFDIMHHARHFPAERVAEITRCSPSRQCCYLFQAAGVADAHQQQYAYGALYRHCAKYTARMPGHRVRPVPVDHMHDIPLLPVDVCGKVSELFGNEECLPQLMCWLRNVIVHQLYRPTSVTIPTRCRHVAKRRRGGSKEGGTEQLDKLQSAVQNILSGITQASPDLLPNMTCAVMPLPPARLSIALYVQRPAPCDE